ncbi:hypothetical protein HK101_001288 [Irineochytrium annulatum]|nr:hypothetical protein HK101_001288 [Irineochytrium annulatum]
MRSHLSGNKITMVSGLEALPALQTLHIDNQRTSTALEFHVKSMEALSGSLKTLTATSNRINDLTALTALGQLNSLDLSNNEIKEWDEIKNILVCCPELSTLNVSSNPVMQQVLKLRQRCILISPNLVDRIFTESFNDKAIPRLERDFLHNMDVARRRSSNRASQSAAIAHQQQGTQQPHFAAGGLPPDFDPNNAAAAFNITSQFKLGGGITMAGDELRPIPHLPPYASQYRDLMLYQMAAVSKAAMPATTTARRNAIRSGIRRAQVARAAETSLEPRTAGAFFGEGFPGGAANGGGNGGAAAMLDPRWYQPQHGDFDAGAGYAQADYVQADDGGGWEEGME